MEVVATNTLLHYCINIEDLKIDINNEDSKLKVASLDPDSRTVKDQPNTPTFYNLKKLKFAYHNTDFDDSDNVCFITSLAPNLTRFKYIYYDGTAPDDSLLESMASHNPQLKEIVIDPTGYETSPLCDISDDAILSVLVSCSIETLDISYTTNVTGALFQEIGNAKKLKELSIYRGDLNDGTEYGQLEDNIQFGGGVLENLQVLQLQGDWDDTIISDLFFDSLIENVPNLREFHLSVFSDIDEDTIVDLNPLKKIFSAYKLNSLTLELKVSASDEDTKELKRLAKEQNFSLSFNK
jgi:hypothetical protein